MLVEEQPSAPARSHGEQLAEEMGVDLDSPVPFDSAQRSFSSWGAAELELMQEKVASVLKAANSEIQLLHQHYFTERERIVQQRLTVLEKRDAKIGSGGASPVADGASPVAASEASPRQAGDSTFQLLGPVVGARSPGDQQQVSSSRSLSNVIHSTSAMSTRSALSKAVRTTSTSAPPLDSDATQQNPIGGFAATPSTPHLSMSLRSRPSTDTAASLLRRTEFKLLPEFEETQEEGNLNETHFAGQIEYYANLQNLHNRKFMELRGYQTDKQMSPAKPASRLIMHPSCHFRLVWDVMACILLAYDVYVIPLAVFDLPREGFFFLMSTVVMLYWSADIILTFFVGFYLPDGDVEMRFWPVMKRYCTSWLLPDLIVVGVDWLMFVDGLSENAGSAGILRVGKASRIFRLVRLLRVVRMRKIVRVMEKLNNKIGLESTAIILSIAKNILAISLLNHVMAACWFWIGLQNEEEGWLAGRKSSHWFDNYIVALQWSTHNFTPGTSGIGPRTTAEYSFHVFALLLALVIFSVFVSSTTSLITKLMSIKSTRTRKMWLLKGFLRQHGFPADFRDRVLRYVQTAVGAHRDRILREDVELLKVLSKPLREEVQSILQLTTMKVHPLLRLLSTANPPMMRNLCIEAVSEVVYSRGDIIFTYGERMDKMIFVVSGVCSYEKVHKGEDDVPRPDKHPDFLGPMDSLCEAALWTRWQCRGTLSADADCELLEIDGSSFRRCVTGHHILTHVVRQYAEAFLEDLNSTTLLGTSGALGDAPQADVLSDLQSSIVHEGEAVQMVLSIISQPPRRGTSQPSLATLGKVTNASSSSSCAYDLNV